jgi:hypothetical protein
VDRGRRSREVGNEGKEKRWQGGGAAKGAGRLDQPSVGGVVSDGQWEGKGRR